MNRIAYYMVENHQTVVFSRKQRNNARENEKPHGKSVELIEIVLGCRDLFM